MSNTVITNYTDLNGPSTKADSSVVVIVNKDGSLSVDQKLLGTLMGTDGSQGAGISVVRVGHEGRPDDATDSETEDDKIPHVTLSVDSYYDEPNSIIKYDSGAEMLQSLRIETRENSLVGFQNDHCYTPLTSPPSHILSQRNDNFPIYDEPVIEITHTPPPKPVPVSKKITILEQQIIPKGKKIVLNSTETPLILKGNDVLNKPLPVSKSKNTKESEKNAEGYQRSDENGESSSVSSSGESIPDRDSDSDYRDNKDKTGPIRLRKSKLKPRILKSVQTSKAAKLDPKVVSRLKSNKNLTKRENKNKNQQKIILDKRETDIDLESILPNTKIAVSTAVTNDLSKQILKQTPKPVKKEKKTPAHVTALLSDMTSLFSTPDVIRRVSTDNKPLSKVEKDSLSSDKKPTGGSKSHKANDVKSLDNSKFIDTTDKSKIILTKSLIKQKEKAITSMDKNSKGYEPIPHIDEASLAQILQDTTGISNPVKTQPAISSGSTMNSPGLAGPLSPTLDLLGGLQPEEEGLTEDLLMHVAQLVESSENLQEVIDKQVLGKVDTGSSKTPVQSPFQQLQGSSNLYAQTITKSGQKNIQPRKDPIEIVRRDGRVITLPPIEAPATRSSKRKSQMESPNTNEVLPAEVASPVHPVCTTPEPQVQTVSKQYINKKLSKKQESLIHTPLTDKISAESQESWNSEDDPNRLWCICKQPHNNRFMICCDACEDWFHGKCVNITKAMGQQMEEQGIEWRCPNCIKKPKPQPKIISKVTISQKKNESEAVMNEPHKILAPIIKDVASKTSCIVCKKPARASSIYCSDSCILKHAQDSLGSQSTPTKTETGQPQEKQKSDPRVIVFERKSGKLLAGPNAPTTENLKDFLQKNPTFEVVRPGTLSTIRPGASKKKMLNDSHKIQTTLNFERIPRKSVEQIAPAKIHQPEVKERAVKLLPSPKQELKIPPLLKTPINTKTQQQQIMDTPKASTSSAKTVSEPRKLARSISNRTQSYEKAPSVSPSISRRKDTSENRSKMNSVEPIRDNVRKALQEQMSIRMTENTGSKFTEDEIQDFAYDTESELHELFRDVGMKYKAKYRSLMFNIKDRKNLSLWQKICDRSITPKQLVRLSPEELASQELAQWRDKEAKYQLELIKKSELDLLAASKTYVLKTHKGEEVMENKESVSTELDPNVPVEDLVTALNDSTVGEDISKEITPESANKAEENKHTRKREREDSTASRSKKGRRDSKRDSESRKSRSSRRKSELKESREEQRRSTRRSDKKSTRARSVSKERSKPEPKEKIDTSEHPRYRSRSRVKSRRRTKSREHSRSASQGRERSTSRARTPKRRHSSRSRRIMNVDEKTKHRSRSQDNVYNNIKTDSTDSDSVERPKSAMMKELHPEYDPHEPMITSAFSEEDLGKSREDVFDESYKNEVGNNVTDVAEFDSSNTLLIDTNVIMPSSTCSEKQDKTSEAESDQEPSSTVDNSSATVWNGCINMVDVARFYVAAHEVSGSAVDLEEDLSTELDIVGRINPDTVWDYISKMKKASNKDIVILRLQAANDEEKMQYIALYSYLSCRNRLGVVKVSNTTTVKDFYIVPLPANTTLPDILFPLDGPGIGEVKTHLLIAIVIRQRKKRLAAHIPKDIMPAKVARESRKRSYTPPLVAKSTYTPPAALPLPYTSPALSTSVKDKIAASLACADDEEAYSPGSSSSSGSVPALASQSGPASTMLRSKMEELNRQIEEQKQQILKMAQADSSVDGENEAYSPSRPMTPPSVVPPALADIALPSNLQEILATIKQRSETASADVDMRTMPLP